MMMMTGIVMRLRLTKQKMMRMMMIYVFFCMGQTPIAIRSLCMGQTPIGRLGFRV